MGNCLYILDKGKLFKKVAVIEFTKEETNNNMLRPSKGAKIVDSYHFNNDANKEHGGGEFPLKTN